MEKVNVRQLALVGILGAVAVALGALGAHALRGQADAGNITQLQLSGFETGVRYHLFHVLAMLAIALSGRSDVKVMKYAFRFFVAGIALFSGSLYLLCTRSLWDAEWLAVLGPVTPIGGVLLIAGWFCMAGPFFKKNGKAA